MSSQHEVFQGRAAESTVVRIDGASILSAVARTVFFGIEAVFRWIERDRQRRALLALPDHLLTDIGISRADAVLEGDKPFWRG